MNSRAPDRTPDLTPDLARLAANLLRLAGNDFGNHGCNDFDLTKIPGFETSEARAALDLAKHTWNGDPEEHDAEGDHRFGYDWCLMMFLADVIEKAAGEPPKKGATEKRTIQVQKATSATADEAIEAGAAVRELEDAKKRAAASIARWRAELDRLEASIK